MVQNAADGVYVLSQQTANGLTPVAQFVSVGGQEYWWLYPGYQAPSLSGPVTLEYTYSGPVPQGFLQNPVPPIQPGPPTNSIPVNATDVAGSGPYNFLVPSASDDKPDPFQIIPMRQAGYLEVLLQTPTGGWTLVGYVVSLLESTVPGTTTPQKVEEHWFYLSSQSEYPSPTQGATTTVKFQPVTFPPTAPPPAWWQVNAATNSGVFQSTWFQQAIAPGSTQVVSPCTYGAPTTSSGRSAHEGKPATSEPDRA